MNFLLEIFFDYFGWALSRKAKETLEKNKAKAKLYMGLFFVLLAAVCFGVLRLTINEFMRN